MAAKRRASPRTTLDWTDLTPTEDAILSALSQRELPEPSLRALVPRDDFRKALDRLVRTGWVERVVEGRSTPTYRRPTFGPPSHDDALARLRARRARRFRGGDA